MPSYEHVQRALREINDRHRTAYELAGRAAGGLNSGAWLLAEPKAVLKLGLGWSVDHLRRAHRAVETVRAHGYPTPRWHAVGSLRDGTRYLVQDHLPGEPGDPLTAAKARQLVQLLERHTGLDPWPERDWNAYVLGEFANARGELRRIAPEASELVDAVDRLLDQLGAVQLPDGDLVHGDFNSCNVLFDGGHVTGAIDLEALGSGSRVVDYAWLLREAYAEGSTDPEIFRVIRTAGEAVAGSEALAYCATFTSCEWLLWMKRNVPESFPAVVNGPRRLVAAVTPHPTKPVGRAAHRTNI